LARSSPSSILALSYLMAMVTFKYLQSPRSFVKSIDTISVSPSDAMPPCPRTFFVLFFQHNSVII